MSSISSSVNSKKNNKVILLGDSGVGKTAIIERFTHNKFQAKQNATIGIDFVGKNISVHGHSYRLQLWDTAGQQRYRSLIPSYLKDAISAIFVFDITNPESVNNLQSWIQLYKQSKSDKSFLVACGNKTDLKQKQSYSEEKLKFLVDKYKLKLFFVSALNGEGVSQMFESIIQLIHKSQQKKKKKYDENEMLPFSSQNLHNDQLSSSRSNLSNRSNRSRSNRGSKNQPQQANSKSKTSEKIQETVIKIQQPVSLKKQTTKAEIQGENRCC